MVFKLNKSKNSGMPSRHISPQSFDEILSELGDDPAIPDPHGIRKSQSFKNSPPEANSQNQTRLKMDVFSSPDLTHQVKKWGVTLAVIGCLFGIGIAVFMSYESNKVSSQAFLEVSQRQISELKKEMAFLRNEILEEQNKLYEEIDSLEVSIHSLKESRLIAKPIYKPQAIPHESELRRWRYLGSSYMSNSHKAFFHNGKGHSSFEKGAPVLGDWRLSRIEKELATMTHVTGKSLVLKTSKSE